ncbi:hypothetical protein V7056_15520 [Bacillus sp. JJ664]
MNLIKKLKTSFQIKLSNDGRFLCHTMGLKTIVFDANSWEKVAELSKPKNPGDIKFSKNNDYLYIKNTIGTVCVYETSEFCLIKTIQSNRSRQMVEGDFALTNDDFTIIDILKTKSGNQLALINIDNGNYNKLTDFEDSITIKKYEQYISNEGSHLFTLNNDNENTDYDDYNLLKVKYENEKASFTLISHPKVLHWESVIYDSIHEVYILVSGFEITILDSTFKKILKKKNLLKNESNGDFGYFYHLHQSNNAKFLVITYSEHVFILRYDDLQIIVDEAISYACFAEFSEDDQYLFIGTWNNGYILEVNLK